MALIADLLLQAVQMVLVVAIAPAVLGLTRKVKARLLRRIGPPVLQPYSDLWKLMHKEAVLAENASWVYRVAPYLIFAATWVAAALVPSYATGLLFSWSADLIAIVALLGTARFALACPSHHRRPRGNAPLGGQASRGTGHLRLAAARRRSRCDCGKGFATELKRAWVRVALPCGVAPGHDGRSLRLAQ